MLTLKVSKQELYDERNERFIVTPEKTIRLEHSLVSLSKWESKWHKPFLSTKEKTHEEMLDYIKFMTITQNVDDIVYDSLNQDHVDQITDYINNPMTATTFSDMNNKPSYKIITAEIIYYWLVTFQIPFECQKWHLNRLLTLVKVCSIKNSKPKRMNREAIFRRNRELNAQRKAQMNTTG